MAVQVTKSTKSAEYKKQIGMMECEVVAFNPDREALTELLGVEPEKDPEYLGEKDGNTTLRLSIWLKELKSGNLFNGSIFLENKEVENKDKDVAGFVKRYQYVNARGKSQYAADPSELPAYFTQYEYHKARVGEVALTSFLDSWLKIDRTVDYNILPDWPKLMKGVVKEFTDLQKSDITQTVVVPATIRAQEKDGEKKEYQNVFTRRWLPGWTMKFFRLTDYNATKVAELRDKNDRIKEENKQKTGNQKKTYLKNHEYFILDVSDPEFGITDIYSLAPLHEYNPEEHVAGSEAVAKITADDSDY